MRTQRVFSFHQSAMAMLCTIAFASSLAAQTPEELSKFETVDLNGDACVDWGELRNAASIVFHSLDHNGDGRIAAEELLPVDTSDQGLDLPPVEPEAFQAQVRMDFEANDADGNGCLSAEEYNAM